MAMIHEPRPRHTRYRGHPRLRLRERHPTIAGRLLGALLMLAVLYLTLHNLVR